MARDDHIRFFTSADLRGEVIPIQPWAGDWPPPPEIGILYGKACQTPHRLVTDPLGELEVREHVAAQDVEFDNQFEIRWFTRDSYSKLTEEDMLTMTHVARGAAYIPKESNELGV